MEGSEWHCKQWINNCIANHSRTGSLCPVLQQEARVFTPLSNGEGLGGGAYSRTGPPCPVLQQEARVFTPLSNGEGLGVGMLVSVPCSTGRWRGWGFCIFMQYCERFLKPIKLQSESMGFRLWKQGFQDVKPRVLGCETKGFANEGYHFWKV